MMAYDTMLVIGLCTFVHRQPYGCMCIRRGANLCMHACMYVCMYVCVYVCMYVYM